MRYSIALLVISLPLWFGCSDGDDGKTENRSPDVWVNDSLNNGGGSGSDGTDGVTSGVTTDTTTQDVPECQCTLDSDCTQDTNALKACEEAKCDNCMCVIVDRPDGVVCSIADKCQQDLTCSAGQCVGTAINCDDNDMCTVDSCAPDSGCRHQKADNGTECDDGNECTTKTKCQNGLCLGGKNTCPEDCENGIDDNKDGLSDCLDPKCASKTVCEKKCVAVGQLNCGDKLTAKVGGDGSTDIVDQWSCALDGVSGAESGWTFKTPEDASVKVTLSTVAENLRLLRVDDAADLGCLPQFCAQSAPSVLEFEAEADSNYWFVVESDDDAAGEFNLEVACTYCEPQCATNQCGPDGCGGKCGTCTGGFVCSFGQCTKPADNQTCETASELNMGLLPIILDSTTAGGSDDYSLSANNPCKGSEGQAIGVGTADAVFKVVPAETGDYLVAIGSEFNASVYVVTGCAGIDSSCVGAANQAGGGEKLTVTLEQGETYYIIVDGNALPAEGSFTLTINTDPCNPDCTDKSCGNDGCGGACGECTGTAVCANGKCTNAATNSDCGSALAISSVPFALTAETDAATDNFATFPEVCPGGPKIEKTGAGSKDLVYRFVAPSNGKYAVEVTPQGDFDPFVSIFTECPATVLGCVAGSSTGGVETAEFVVSKSQTVWIVVDGTVPGAVGGFSLELTQVACTPKCTGKQCGSDQCGGECGQCGADKTCSQNGQCVIIPINDTCSGAEVIDSLPYSFDGSNEGANGDYEVAPGVCPDGPASATYGKGNDVTFKYTSPIAQTVAFSFESSFTTLNTFLYAVSDCENVGTSCLKAATYSPIPGTDSLILNLAEAQTIFVIVDGWASSSVGQYYFKAAQK